jgi:hypothetical protein
MCVWGCGWWHDLGPQAQGAIFSVGGTIFVAVIGIGVVFLQLQGALRTSRITEQMKLKKETYEEIADQCAEALKLTNAARTHIWNFLGEARMGSLRNHHHAVVLGKGERCAAQSDPAVRAVHELGIRVKRWRIIDPRIIIFESAFESVLHEATRFIDRLRGRWTGEADVQVQDMITAVRELERRLAVTERYMIDLETAMQNALLGDLFEKRLPPRISEGPGDIVVTFERYEELDRHFKNETSWGKEWHTKTAHQQSLAIISSRSPSPP